MSHVLEISLGTGGRSRAADILLSLDMPPLDRRGRNGRDRGTGDQSWYFENVVIEQQLMTEGDVEDDLTKPFTIPAKIRPAYIDSDGIRRIAKTIRGAMSGYEPKFAVRQVETRPLVTTGDWLLLRTAFDRRQRMINFLRMNGRPVAMRIGSRTDIMRALGRRFPDRIGEDLDAVLYRRATAFLPIVTTTGREIIFGLHYFRRVG